jgi:hypothetical protein
VSAANDASGKVRGTTLTVPGFFLETATLTRLSLLAAENYIGGENPRPEKTVQPASKKNRLQAAKVITCAMLRCCAKRTPSTHIGEAFGLPSTSIAEHHSSL